MTSKEAYKACQGRLDGGIIKMRVVIYSDCYIDRLLLLRGRGGGLAKSVRTWVNMHTCKFLPIVERVHAVHY